MEVVGEGLATPVTAGGSGVLAAYEAVQTVSQVNAGLTQIGGALSGKTEATNKAADAMIVGTSILGTSTLAKTKGDLDAASKAAALEGMVTSSATRSIFNTFGSILDTAMNIQQTAQKPAPNPVPPPKPPTPPPAPPPAPGCVQSGNAAGCAKGRTQ